MGGFVIKYFRIKVKARYAISYMDNTGLRPRWSRVFNIMGVWLKNNLARHPSVAEVHDQLHSGYTLGIL